MESERAKKEYESLSFMWMEHLFEGKCTQKLLINASFYLEPRHFKEVLEERNLNNCCGYPICDKEPKKLSGKYHIQVENRKVVETNDLNKFCSKFCQRAFNYYKLQLSSDPIYFKDIEKWQPVNLLEDEELTQSQN
ncbi:hypothetical protein CONCODRAFT_77745 [Conidiobolus coronatus NRRL 28638]|uniref:RNA polymerase II subunit B1 CTD phosphatase RPAP2 homolog n=1 Tax=Conidiobolus coronatus (strain ATCC 28846 / CBS 209.66 / NRRL 28638) TaxID=796925 RepID=A0A137PC57_CONC2|nr:hypothetical protein CONCODRAFT_77745 [Conidiobolus coronatus NRRL 28638]|eukprot:KXN72563.1 hypothetical protein CONCODRAFT_77745 [Conidiobolus coronatus NRRL 28638]